MIGSNGSLFAALIVAFVAGAFSLKGLVVSKDQKVSEFRQAWIDALRQEIANLIAHANIIHAELIKLGKEEVPNKVEFLRRTRKNYIAANKALTRIKLGLNPKEQESRDLIIAIKKLEGFLTRDFLDLRDTDDAELHFEIENAASVVLKNEWERVKEGELIFRIISWGAICLIALSVAAFFLAFAFAPAVSSAVGAFS